MPCTESCSLIPARSANAVRNTGVLGYHCVFDKQLGEQSVSVVNRRTSVLSHLIAERNTVAQPRILVVGCGRGIEAAVLAQDLGADVTGIDLDTRFDPEAARHARLMQGDATALAFDDESFDIVYSYHALEHIPDYHKALDEMRRVLRGGAMVHRYAQPRAARGVCRRQFHVAGEALVELGRLAHAPHRALPQRAWRARRLHIGGTGGDFESAFLDSRRTN